MKKRTCRDCMKMLRFKKAKTKFCMKNRKKTGSEWCPLPHPQEVARYPPRQAELSWIRGSFNHQIKAKGARKIRQNQANPTQGNLNQNQMTWPPLLMNPNPYSVAASRSGKIIFLRFSLVLPNLSKDNRILLRQMTLKSARIIIFPFNRTH